MTKFWNGCSKKNEAMIKLFHILAFITCLCDSQVLTEDAVEYSIVTEYATCDHIIPKFIEQVMSRPEASCEQEGEFPKPGNCSVFFKCVQSDARIQPLIEYCATGYNFVNGVCVPNTNISDCPQYTCRIPDGANQIGNELSEDENTGSGPVSFSPLISTPVPQAGETSSTSTREPISKETPTNQVEEQEVVHSEQLMSMTQAEKNSASTLKQTLLLFVITYHLLLSHLTR